MIDLVTKNSDVDFLVEFGESERTLFRQYMGFIGALEDILGVFAHVTESQTIKKPHLKLELDRTKLLIYEKALIEVPAI